MIKVKELSADWIDRVGRQTTKELLLSAGGNKLRYLVGRVARVNLRVK